MTTYWVGSNITAIRDHEFEIIITSLKHIFIIKIRTITIYTFLPMRNKFLCSVAKSCPTLCKPMNCRTPDFPVLYHLLEFAQTQFHWAIQPSHPLLPPLPPALSLSHDFNCEIKRYLLLARKAMTNLDIILKSRDITLLTKVRLFKAMVFPLVIYVCESWTMKKGEHQRIHAFKLQCWKRL